MARVIAGPEARNGHDALVYAPPAPVVASAPAADGRRAFSAEPSTTPCTAPAVASVPATNGRRAFSVEPMTVQPAAPGVLPIARTRASGPEYNRFGKGPTTIGLMDLAGNSLDQRRSRPPVMRR
jgi:hypothetical protein